MKANTKNIPALRFPEFKDEWNKKTLKDVCIKIQDGNYGEKYPKKNEFVKEGIPFLTSKAIGSSGLIDMAKVDYISMQTHSLLKKAQLEYNDVLFTNRGSNVGTISIVDSRIANGNIGPQLTLLRSNTTIIKPLFLKYILTCDTIRSQILSQDSGSAMNFFGIETTSKFKFSIPSLLEQQKIADFLTAVDERIQQLTKKKQLLEQYKKGVMQQLFSQQLRFKDENGNNYPDWEEYPLQKLAKKVTLKNKDNNVSTVLTNSATMGIVSQADYFDNDVANANNLSGYYVVELNDFVYNPRISTTAPVGPIKRNKLIKGLMSPLYTVFRMTDINIDFAEQYFNTNLWHDYMKSVANYGARHDRMSIGINDFMNLPIPYPCIDEQMKIATFINSLDQKIDSASLELEKRQAFKKGLLQQMFV